MLAKTAFAEWDKCHGFSYQQRWIKTFHILLSLPLSQCTWRVFGITYPSIPWWRLSHWLRASSVPITHKQGKEQSLLFVCVFLHLIPEIAESIRLHYQWSVCLCIVHNNVLLSSWTLSKQMSVFAWIACACVHLWSDLTRLYDKWK